MVKPDRDDVFALVVAFVDELDVLMTTGTIAISYNDSLVRRLSL